MAFRGDLEALVLGVLEDGPLHGYEISKRIRLRSGDVFSFGEGHLYPCLHGLERSGLVNAQWQPQEGKPARKVYAVTDAGVAELSKKRKDWAKFSDAVSAVLIVPKQGKEATRG
jgi:PadR family transcriptional regulator, regulatory protein PadR